MSSVAGASVPNQTPDLSLLKDMVGVQKALKALVSRRVPLDKEAVLGVLEAQEEIYATGGMFRAKNVALKVIIAGLRQETISVEAVLQAAGIETTATSPAKGGFSMGKLLGKIRAK
jgi:hypothetical protein